MQIARREHQQYTPIYGVDDWSPHKHTHVVFSRRVVRLCVPVLPTADKPATSMHALRTTGRSSLLV